MKQLQNNFTTPEQSKRLLELGMPANSADCYYEAIGFNNGYESVPQICSNVNFGINVIDIPCWSVGRLIEIYVIARGVDTAYLPFERDEDMVKYLIRLYEEKAKDMDFSKLEE